MSKSGKTVYDQNRRHSDRKHSARKRVNNISVVCVVVGCLTLVIAVGMVMVWGLGKGDALIILAPYYAGTGVILLTSRFVMFRAAESSRQKNRLSRSRRPSGGSDIYSRSSSKSGAAFILVMVLVSLLTAMLLQSQWLARSTHRLQEGYLLDARLRASATRAMEDGLKRLANDPDLSVDALSDEWAEDRELDWPDGSAHVVRILDLNRFYDLNNVYMETANRDVQPGIAILMDLMTEAGQFTPVNQAEAIQDWVDPDQEGIREAWFYDQEKLGYVPPNNWLQTWGELLWVYGVDRETWKPLERYGRVRRFEAGLLDMTTILPGRRGSPNPVNVNTASLETLRGVLGPRMEAAAASILALREGQPITHFSLIAARIGDPLAFEAIRPYLSVGSEFFSVRVRSYLEGRTLDAAALARRDEQGQVHILRWVM